MGASPAAFPPSPSLPSLPHSLSPAAQGPSSRWEIRHHDTNKLPPYFKRAQQGSAPLRVCACLTHVHFSVCVCVYVYKHQQVSSKMPRQQLSSLCTNLTKNGCVQVEEESVAVPSLTVHQENANAHSFTPNYCKVTHHTNLCIQTPADTHVN